MRKKPSVIVEECLCHLALSTSLSHQVTGFVFLHSNRGSLAAPLGAHTLHRKLGIWDRGLPLNGMRPPSDKGESNKLQTGQIMFRKYRSMGEQLTFLS